MRINHNISALRSNRSLTRNNNALSASIERLSSGYKINKAADDSAGMAISRKMRTQIAALDQSGRNGSDGISVIQTAEGALNEITSMIQRMRELAVEAANDTYTMDDRKNIQEEIDQLCQEIDRLSEQTEYNTKNLLNGGLQRVNNANSTSVEVLSLSDEVLPAGYDFSIAEYGSSATLEMAEASGPLEGSGSIQINGETVLLNAGESADSVNEKIRDLCECVGINWDMEEGVMSTVLAGAGQKIEVRCSENVASLLGISTSMVSEPGTDAQIELGESFSSTATVNCIGNRISITDSEGFSLEMELDPNAEEVNDEVVLTVEDAGPLIVQIGANENQEIAVAIPKISAKTLGLNYVNVRSYLGATTAISRIDEALEKVTAARSKLGAYQNRFDSAIASLAESEEDVTHAMSRVEDVDMAQEMTEYSSRDVLVQAGESMLAQANSRPQNVLTMLQM